MDKTRYREQAEFLLQTANELAERDMPDDDPCADIVMQKIDRIGRMIDNICGYIDGAESLNI